MRVATIRRTADHVEILRLAPTLLRIAIGERVGERLHRWMFKEPEKNAKTIEGTTTAVAYIMGRNMFNTDRGA